MESNAHPELLRLVPAVEHPTRGADDSEDYDGDGYGTARSDHLGFGICDTAGPERWLLI
jgi:hypothetical protein